MRKKVIRGTVMILIVVITGTVLSGFSGSTMTEDEYLMYRLLYERTAIMQKAIFRVYDSQDGVADIEEVYDAFHSLADIETYPLLSEDCTVISESAGTDFDKVINLDVQDVKFISKTGPAAFYDAEIKWYMSGDSGAYDMTCCYKIMTYDDRGSVKLASMDVIS